MGLDLTDLKSLYDDFLTKGIERLAKLQETTQMEDEFLATASSNVIVGAMTNSIQALETLKRSQLIDKQIDTEIKKALDVASSTSVRDAQSSQDILNKAAQVTLMTKQAETETNKALDVASSTSVRDAESSQDISNKKDEITIKQNLANADIGIKTQQELAEKIKNGGINFAYSIDSEGKIISKSMTTVGTGKSIYEYQTDKLMGDTDFVKEQKTQLTNSVVHNNRLKTLDSYKGYLGDIGLGGFVIPADASQFYFDMVGYMFQNNTPEPKSLGLTENTQPVKVPTATPTVLAAEQ